MLNPVAKKWVKALRSRKFKQAHRQLGDAYGRRCCLGVLCDLAVKDGVVSQVNYNDVFLPHEVREWAGLQSNKATYNSKQGRDRGLWQDNDGDESIGVKAKPFSKIADIIESEPEGLFV